MKFLHRMIVLCLIAVLAAAVSPLLANGSQPANVAQAQEGGVSLYIPLVMKYHTSELPPFAIQIAGLSQITTSSAFARLSTAEAAETQAQLVAELDAAFPTMLEALKDSGAGYVRVYIDWASIQPVKGGDYAWSFYDKRLPQLHQAGLGLIATVTNAPLWAKVNQEDCGIISDTQAYYSFLTALEQQYPYIEVWEILNEPDAVPPYRCGNGVMNYGEAGQEYADLLQGAYDLLKGLNPATTVIMGGMAYDGFVDEDTEHFNRYFLDDMIVSGGASAMDGVNFHYFKNYAGGWEGWTHDGKPTCLGAINVADPEDTFYSPYGFDVIAKTSHISERLSTCYGVSPSMWLTETGANGVGPQNKDANLVNDPQSHLFGADLADQARYVYTVHARGFASGIENITWYALKILPELTPEDHQGLLFDARDNKDGVVLEDSPKPSFYAYKTLTRELGYYRYSNWVAFDPRTKPQAEAYQFKHLAGQNAGKDKLVAWSNSSNPVPLTLSNTQIRVVSCPVNGGSAAEVTVTDGGAGDADGAANGSIRLNLTIDPVIIELMK